MSLQVGVVVIGRNEGPRLGSSLQSVLDQNVALIYVDSGSTDDSLAIAAKLGVTVHELDSKTPFSAARGRNEGFAQLIEQHAELSAVLFLDGDCTIDEAVIPAGIRTLEANDKVALVCSPVREVDRDRDVWKLLCDLEWDQEPGLMDHCGGIFMIRAKAFRAIGGMDASIVAGEEPEMCLMLKREGWQLLRIEEGLVLHDVGEFNFMGWWIRCRRAGLAFLLGFLRDGFTADRQNFREAARPWFWCLLLPVSSALLIYLWGTIGLLLLLLYPLQLIKMIARSVWRGRPFRDACVYSLFNMIGHWAEASGQARLLFSIVTGSAPAARELRSTPLYPAHSAQLAHHPTAPQIGVVVIGRNEGERLHACLRSLIPLVDLLVYVDSGSTDDSTAFAKKIGADVIDLDMSTPFTAARARNTGFARLLELSPELDLVQFVDGDCEVDAKWLATASKTLQQRPDVVAVTGRRREQHPEVSIYNRLADMEWNTPLGPVKWCGGDVLMRADALQDVGGYDPLLIACEEPELCFRLRAKGWIVLRIDAEMTLHDADITHFSQWWKRSTRTGYAYLQASALHRGEPGPFMRREIRSAVIWGMLLPLLVVAALFKPWLWILVLFALSVQALRITRHRQGNHGKKSWAFTCFSILINFPIAMGMWRYFGFRLLGRQSRLIEYK